MYFWKAPLATLAAQVRRLLLPRRQPQQQQQQQHRHRHPVLPPHPVLRLLQPRLKEARTVRAVQELLAVAVHLPLGPAEREKLVAEAMETLARLPSGIVSPRSSRSKSPTARSTKTRPQRR